MEDYYESNRYFTYQYNNTNNVNDLFDYFIDLLNKVAIIHFWHETAVKPQYHNAKKPLKMFE